MNPEVERSPWTYQHCGQNTLTVQRRKDLLTWAHGLPRFLSIMAEKATHANSLVAVRVCGEDRSYCGRPRSRDWKPWKPARITLQRANDLIPPGGATSEVSMALPGVQQARKVCPRISSSHSRTHWLIILVSIGLGMMKNLGFFLST